MTGSQSNVVLWLGVAKCTPPHPAEAFMVEAWFPYGRA